MKLTQSLKLFSILMFSLLFISMVSAELTTFDNVKSYDAQTKTVKIKNLFGLGETYADIQLKSPLNVVVSRGYNKVAEFEVRGYVDYQDFIKELEFYNIKNKMSKINRDFDLKLLSYETVEVEDWETICTDQILKNETVKDCERVLVGSHFEDKEVWTKLTPADMKKNENMTIGIFTDVQAGDRVDWIPNFAGVRVEEWATWTESLEVGLVSYWSMENPSTALTDNKSLNTLTASNSPIFQSTGIVNFGTTIDDNNDYFIKGSCSGNLDYGTTGDFTLNIWVKTSDTDGDNVLFRSYTTQPFYRLNLNGGNIYGEVATSGGADRVFVAMTGSISDNNWHMITFKRENSGQDFYLYDNGVLNNSATGQATKDANCGVLELFDSRTDRNFNGNLDEFGIWNRSLSNTEIQDLYNSGLGLQYGDYASSQLEITLNSPEDYYNSTSQTINFNVTVTDNLNVENVSLLIDGSIDQTNTSQYNGTYLFSKTLSDGDYNWSISAFDNESYNEISETRFFTIDTLDPVITDAYNLTNLTVFSLPTNSSWHFNASDSNIDSCYYNTTDHSQKIITCNSTIETEWATQGIKEITYCANDTFGYETCKTDEIQIFLIAYDQANNPESIAEGFEATFNLTVNMTNIPTTTANLIINNTVYVPDTTTAGTNGYFFEKTITIPDGWGNATGILQDWYWNYTITGVTSANTSTDNITVYALAIDDCSSYTDVILNFTLKDEETKTPVNESAGANVEVDLVLTSKTDNDVYLTYSNTWMDDNNPKVCLPANVLNNSQYWLDLTVGFSSTDHVWEFYYIDSGTLNSTKTIEFFNGHTTSNISLMDLLTTDSTSFLFNYFDQDGLAVDDAIVHVMRKYIGDGQFLEVERSKADENGDTIVHLVEEDVIYFFYITQYGELLYTSSTYTALCQTTPCTIQIEASGDGASFDTDWDLIDGGAYTIQDDAGSRIVNMTYSLNDTSTMNVTVFKYSSDGSYTAVASGSDTGSTGSVVLTVPQGAGNVSFFATVYQDGEFVNSEWVDFEEKAGDKIGITLALFLSALIILSLGLMAITEGVGTLVFVLLGVALSGFLGLMRTQLSTGVNIVVYLVVAGGILLYKLTGGRR